MCLFNNISMLQSRQTCLVKQNVFLREAPGLNLIRKVFMFDPISLPMAMRKGSANGPNNITWNLHAERYTWGELQYTLLAVMLSTAG
jgi:hypothetical protein